LLSLLDYWVILNVLLVDVEIVISWRLAKVHVLILNIYNIYMIILVYNLIWLVILATAVRALI
jgi:hypothetical protein